MNVGNCGVCPPILLIGVYPFCILVHSCYSESIRRKTEVSERMGYLSTEVGKGGEQGLGGGRIRYSVLRCLVLGKISNESLM